MKRDDDRVFVIGAGLGGLASACVLAARGYPVTLLERSAWLGGKAAVLEQDGYRFDMGPTILTLPSVLRKIFAEADRQLEAYLQLIELDPQWRCFFSDGARIDLLADVAAMQRNIDCLQGDQGRDARGYARFMHVSQRLHDVSNRYFFWKSVGSLRDTLDVSRTFSPGTLADILSLRMGSTVAGVVRRHVSDARLAQMIDHFTQYVGSSPEASPAVLCGIAHMQTSEGVWYPAGGTRAIPEALIRLAEELQVEFRTGADVRQIIVESGRVNGVQLACGARLKGRAVVSNCDTVRTHDELLQLADRQRFRRRRRYEPACSGVVLYLGLRRRYPQLLHHNFVFSADAHQEFDAIYRRGEPAPDPTCYVCAPALTDSTVAPPGGEALYVLVHTPYLRDHHDWQQMLPDYRATILHKLQSTAGLDQLESNLVTESWLTPADIDRRYHVWKGAIYGLASHGRLWGGFKPANRSRDVQGLYFSGGSAHPGPGMPMVMMSGWIAADALDSDWRAASGGRRTATPRPLATGGSP